MSELSNKNFDQSPRVRNVIYAPEAPATGNGLTPPEAPEKKKNKTLRNSLILGGAGLALTAAAAAGIGILAQGNDESAPNPPTSESVVDNEVETEEGFNAAEKTSEIEGLFDADRLDSADSFAGAFETAFNEWTNAGASEETWKRSMSTSGETETNARAFAAEYDDAYIDAIFVEDWKKNPNLVTSVDRIVDTHGQNLYFNIITFSELEAYKHEAVLSDAQILSETDDTKVVSFTETGKDNNDKNSVEGELTYSATIQMTFTKVGNNWKVSDIILG